MSGIAPRCNSVRANGTFCDHVMTTTRCCMKGWTANKRKTKQKKTMAVFYQTFDFNQRLDQMYFMPFVLRKDVGNNQQLTKGALRN